MATLKKLKTALFNPIYSQVFRVIHQKALKNRILKV